MLKLSQDVGGAALIPRYCYEAGDQHNIRTSSYPPDHYETSSCFLCLPFPDGQSVEALITVKSVFGVDDFPDSMFCRLGEAFSGVSPQNLGVIEVAWHPRTYAVS